MDSDRTLVSEKLKKRLYVAGGLYLAWILLFGVDKPSDGGISWSGILALAILFCGLLIFLNASLNKLSIRLPEITARDSFRIYILFGLLQALAVWLGMGALAASSRAGDKSAVFLQSWLPILANLLICLFLVLLLIQAKCSRKELFHTFALRVGTRSQLLIGSVAALVVMSTVTVVATYSPWMALEGQAERLSAVQAAGGAALLFYVINTLLLAPVLEELLFRGAMFKGFENSWGTFRAAVLVTFLFIIAHLGESASSILFFINIAPISIVLIMLRVRFDALGPSIACHGIYNSVIVFSMLTTL